MLKTAVIGLIIISLTVTIPAFSEESAVGSVTPYLGFSLPYPEQIPELMISLKDPLVSDRSLIINCLIDKKGKVKKVEYPSDSAAFIEPILKDLKKLEFQFIEGHQLAFPMNVPIEVTVAGNDQKSTSVRLRFPLSAEMTANPDLLSIFFARNEIQPPEIIEFQPVFYKVDDAQDGPDYLMVTARVFLDEKGELRDISFPLSKQTAAQHQVQMAVMNARFTPLKYKSESMPSDFLLTFRFFRNLEYPFSPYQAEDSTGMTPLTARYFMSQFYNAADISAPALPRNHSAGQIRAPKLGLGLGGRASLFARIDTTGTITNVLQLSASLDMGDRPEKAVRMIKWYPRRDSSGNKTVFAGKITLIFDGSTRIVYIPEWLKP